MRFASRSPAPTTRATRPPRSRRAGSPAPTRPPPSPRWRTSPARAGASSGSARRRPARSSSTTTPTTPPRSRRRSTPPAPPPPAAAAPPDSPRPPGAPRVLAVFQPHLYSRTQRLATDFGAALARADVVAVLDVYPARERAEDFPGASGLTVARAAAEAAGGKTVVWLADFAAAERALPPMLRDGDVCLVLGAGDVDELGRRLVAGP